MNDRGSFLALCLCMMLSLVGYSQDSLKHDIGLEASFLTSKRIGIDFRTSLNDHWRLRFGGYYGSQNSYPFDSGNIINVTDSVITRRKYQFNSNNFTIKVGGQRRFKTSLFSLTTDILLTYLNTRETYSNNFSILDSSGNWTDATYYQIDNSNPVLGEDDAQVIRHYLTPQIAVGVIMDVPIKRRFMLSLGVEGIAGTSLYLRSSDKVDPLNEFEEPSAGSFNFDFNMSASIAIRYRFGKG